MWDYYLITCFCLISAQYPYQTISHNCLHLLVNLPLVLHSQIRFLETIYHKGVSTKRTQATNTVKYSAWYIYIYTHYVYIYMLCICINTGVSMCYIVSSCIIAAVQNKNRKVDSRKNGRKLQFYQVLSFLGVLEIPWIRHNKGQGHASAWGVTGWNNGGWLLVSTKNQKRWGWGYPQIYRTTLIPNAQLDQAVS